MFPPKGEGAHRQDAATVGAVSPPLPATWAAALVATLPSGVFWSNTDWNGRGVCP
jgi:hypothetical protein